MQTYETDEQQVEAIKRWWQENYKQLLAIAVFALASILGTQYYQENTRLQAEAASNNFNEVLNGSKQNQTDIVIGRTKILKEESAASPYTVLAALLHAKALVTENKIDEAIAELVWAKEQSTDSSIQQIAFIRKLKLMMGKSEFEAALAELEQHLSVDSNTPVELMKITFSPILLETKGDLLVALNRPDDAKKAYDLAMSGLLMAGGSAEILRIKRSDLGK